uniref:Tetraspanin n=1 Tax=Steinernema glaseri TaxID=37863 RepID=A0A1I7XXP4_9BILA
MVYGCGNQVIKFLVFSTNFLIFAFGALIFGFSLWANLDHDFAKHLQEFVNQTGMDPSHLDDLSKYQASLWVLVAVGFLLLIVGFLGCCGAACESALMLTLFFVVILILSVIELGAVIFALVNKTALMESLQQLLQKSSGTADLRKNLLPIENLFQCCGATRETQYLYEQDGLCKGALSGAYDCFSVISEHLERTGEVVIVIAFVLLAIEFFSMVFSCILMRAFGERSPAYYA